MISTGGSQWMDTAKRTMLYGYIEARIRVPEGRGLWPAFWMLSADYGWPPEIDIMEILGHDTSTTHMNLHWNDAGNHQQAGSSFSNGMPLSGGWHTFAVDCSQGSLFGMSMASPEKPCLPQAFPIGRCTFCSISRLEATGQGHPIRLLSSLPKWILITYAPMTWSTERDRSPMRPTQRPDGVSEQTRFRGQDALLTRVRFVFVGRAPISHCWSVD